MMRSNTNQRLKIKWLGLWLACAAGCDRLPDLPTPPVTNVSSEVVTDQGRGGYNWRVQRNLAFEVQRPTSFAFVEQVRTDLIRRNLELPKSVERPTPYRPEGMDDDVYTAFRRYTEAPPEMRLLLEIEQSDDVGIRVACFNFDGDRILTVGKKLIEWDVDTGVRVKEFDAPLEDCQRVFYDRSQESAVLQNADGLARVSLADGRTLHSWKPPEGKIETLACAREADVQGVVTTDKALYALADNFSKLSVYRNKPLASSKIAVHPKGAWILGATDGQMLRWRQDNSDKPSEFIASGAQDAAYSTPMAGAAVDRWINPRFVHECVGTQELLYDAQRYPFSLLNSVPISFASATVEGTEDWLVIVGEKRDAQGRASRFVQDIYLSSFDYSVPCPLPAEQFEQFLTDADCERIAFSVKDKLQIYERRRWVSTTPSMVAERIGMLLLEGRTEQIELAAQELRAVPVFRDGRRGEEVYSQIVQSLGRRWAGLEQQPASPEVMQAIDGWHKGGSALALLASAERHMAIVNAGLSARYAGNALPQSGATFQRVQQAYAELKRLPNQDRLPARALYHLVDAAKFMNLEYQEVEKWLAQSTELYPYDPMPLTAMCYWLGPGWGGNPGEGAALVAALAERYPTPEGDLLYARTALAFDAIFAWQAMGAEAGFNYLRILEAVDPLLSKGDATRTEIELLMELAKMSEKPALLKRLAEYHLQHYGMPSQTAYQRMVINAIGEAREAWLAQMQNAKF